MKENILVKKISGDSLTPVMLLTELNAKVLLESAYYAKGKGKYSILLIDEAFTLSEKDAVVSKMVNNEIKQLYGNVKFLDQLRKLQEELPFSVEVENYPLPLGGIGYLGYEFYAQIEDVTFAKNNDKDLYDNIFIFGRNFIIFDHHYDEIILISVKYSNENEIDLLAEMATLENKIANISLHHEESKGVVGKVVSECNKDSYMRNVEIVKQEIIKGNLLQCVISRQLAIEANLSPLEAYRNLRRKNPSPYMFYFDFGGYKLFGSSPEMMVKCKSRQLTLCPIAGTRPRGLTAKQDEEFELDMINDEKERAEHLMLLDLGRNDLGKIAKFSSVKVNRSMAVEKYSKVMHLVSEVVAELDHNYNSNDAITSTFPAGTVSGAPKLQAICTIEKLEATRRGPYAGLVGYFEGNGDFDSCIVIRSAIYKDGIFYLQAGAGIVYDSVAEHEYIETQNKMAAMVDALNVKIAGA